MVANLCSHQMQSSQFRVFVDSQKRIEVARHEQDGSYLLLVSIFNLALMKGIVPFQKTNKSRRKECVLNGRLNVVKLRAIVKCLIGYNQRDRTRLVDYRLSHEMIIL